MTFHILSSLVGYEDESLHVGFLGELDVDELLSGGHHVLVLDSHNTTSPGSSDVLVVNVSLSEVGGELLDFDHVFGVGFSKSDTGSGLEVDKLSKVGLSTDEAEWCSLLSAKSWEMDNNLNGVDIVSNHNKLCLAFFDEGGHVVKTELKVLWLGTLGWLGTVLLGLSSFLQSLCLLLSGLWGIFLEELHERGSFVLVTSLGELVDGGGDLQSLEKNSLLSLDSDVLWPLDESSEVALWLNISSKTEVSGVLLEKRT